MQMRDKSRIPAVMAKLQAVWEKYPDMRLGQMLMAVIEKHKLQFIVSPIGSKECPPDLYNLEDDQLLEMLEGVDAKARFIIRAKRGLGKKERGLELLASITPENMSDPVDTDFGPDVGRKVRNFDYELSEEDMRVLAFAKRHLVKIVKEDGGWDNFPEDTGSGIYSDEMIDAEARFTMLIRTAKRRMARIIERDDVLACAIEVLETPDNANQWLNSPIPALGGKVPADLLDTDEGVKSVLAILTRIEYGVYS